MTTKLQGEIVANLVSELCGKLSNKDIQSVISKALNLTPLETMRVWDVIQAESLTKTMGL